MANGDIQSRQIAAEARAGEVVLEVVVRCTEIDVNGHVNNAKYSDFVTTR